MEKSKDIEYAAYLTCDSSTKGYDCSCCSPIIINCNNDTLTTPIVKAYGGLFHQNPQVLSFKECLTYQQISLNTTLPNHEVQVNDNNTITILHDGDYLIGYSVLIETNRKIEVAIAIRQNQIELTPTKTRQILSLDDSTMLSTDNRIMITTIVSLQKGDIIDLAIHLLHTLPKDLDVVIDSNANLFVNKIS